MHKLNVGQKTVVMNLRSDALQATTTSQKFVQTLHANPEILTPKKISDYMQDPLILASVGAGGVILLGATVCWIFCCCKPDCCKKRNTDGQHLDKSES